MPLWAQHLVVDYPAAEQFVHPYRVLLAVIQIVYPQPLEVGRGIPGASRRTSGVRNS